MTPTIGSLFTGAGMLDVAVEQLFGAETIWHCENDPAAAKVLAARWPRVPNLGDITTINWDTVEPVDILCGGWPCQPFSLAGQQKGAEDERALWPYVARTVRMVRPRHVVLENVSAVLSAREFDRVADSLAALRYDIAWTCLRASDVGAPHRRERVFILATDSAFSERRGPQQQHLGTTAVGAAEPRERFGASAVCGATAADSPRDGWHEGRPEPARLERGSDAAVSGTGPVELLPTPNASDSTGGGAHPDNREGHSRQLIDYALLHGSQRWGKYEPAIRRWETHTRPAPPPTEPNTKGNPRLAAAFSEWMMGWPDGWATQVPGISRNDALRIIGNGVCPQQAAAALAALIAVCEGAA